MSELDKKIKKYILIGREKCIGCGACVAASEGLCDFIDGKAWGEKKQTEDFEEIISVCPVDCISATDDEDEYDKKYEEYEIDKLLEED